MVRHLTAALLIAAALARSPDAAPVPPARNAPPPCVQGRWLLDWGGTPYRMTLDAQGGYYCWCATGAWEGTYTYDGRTGWLCVRERGGGGGTWFTWRVRLGGRLCGEAWPVGVRVRLRTAEVR